MIKKTVFYPMIYWGGGNRIIDTRKPFFCKDDAQIRARRAVNKYFEVDRRPFVKVATKKIRWDI